ncbi:Sac2 family-domain-containing protein [Mycotypha africana]|uniref:Sac2 family-domain-containing protein n=1 Tax=Mycotypha africana TaxID=64632 RepID=UPI002300F9E1|nr:Sac2 family-domain-containing protein [Mycotypha africana]KAI8968291.1 Sac2 family-domain-containing protein [Mycotypha africana]
METSVGPQQKSDRVKPTRQKSLPPVPFGDEDGKSAAAKPTTPKQTSNALKELDILLQNETESIDSHRDETSNIDDDAGRRASLTDESDEYDDDSIEFDFEQLSFELLDDQFSAFQEDDIVKQALENEMDLREYAKQIADEKAAAQRDVENNYLEHIQSFVDLHTQIQSCDEVLGRMEELLNVFQSDLGNISGEIQNLQEQSSQMSVKLKNRKAVETKLGKVLHGMVIPPYVIKKITEEDIDDVWLEYLVTINHQMQFVKTNQHRPIKALRNVGPELEKLRLKATSTIRDFFMSHIQTLSVPNANIQIMQQSVFLKYKELHYFVIERHHEAAKEIRHSYMNSLRWYFQSHFERYSKGLQKLQTTAAADYRSDLIGTAEEGMRKIVGSGLLFGSSKIALKDKVNVFALGDRSDTLRMQDPGVILVHVAESKDQKYQFEQLFRSFNLTLIDNASSEFLFIHEFFSRDPKTAADTAKVIFHYIFEPTERVGMNFTKTYVENSYDAVGILLCIRINTQLALELQRRKIPALEGYTNATNMLLWPRFQYVMTLHIESLKKMFNNKAVMNAVKDIHAHYVTRRYAEFAASLLVLNDGYDDAILVKSVQKLRDEFEAVLSRMSHEFQESARRIAFLINNYDLIISVLQETHSRGVESELEYMKQMLLLQTSAFVDEQLKPYFGELINFVRKREKSTPPKPSGHSNDRTAPTAANNMSDTFDDDIIPELERISNHFAQTWRQSLRAINASVIQYFSNFKMGTSVLHAVLAQLIVYYTKFSDILEKQQQKINSNEHYRKIQPVGVQTVMVEIKKYRSTF